MWPNLLGTLALKSCESIQFIGMRPVGSWGAYEGRSPKCCLLVYIDDATGRLMNLRFSDTESAFDYMVATREYLDQHGKPVAFYSDKHSIFRVNQEHLKKVGLN